LNTAAEFNLTYCAVLTTFNAEKTVVQALESVLAQSILPAEIIIVDDCSSDATLKILESKFGRLPNIRIIVNRVNSGQSYSRNAAANLASADVIVIFDDDDVSLPDRAKVHLQLHQDGSNFSFVSSIKEYSEMYQISCNNEDRKLVRLEAATLLKRLVFGHQSDALGKIWIPASTSAFDRKYFLAIGGYDVQMRRLEDAELVIRAAMKGCISSWSSKILVNRKSTHSNIKGGTIEMDFEKLLLMKYQDLLTKSEFKRALSLINVRHAYFSKDFLLLFRLTFLHPSLLFGGQGRFFAFTKRILHDRRQRG
jgi:glycosyltransferase involved in cell wall biosynthesis